MTVAADHLRAFVERMETLEEQKAAIASDIKDVFAEAKGSGYDVKALRAVIRLRKQDADERREFEAILETYMHALGMLSDTPLGQAAVERAVSPKTRAAFSRMSKTMGTPVEPTADEREKGVIAAWIDKDGTRCSVGTERSS